MKKLLAVCLTALVCWVCAGYAEETRVGDTVIFGQYEQDGNLDNGSEPIAWQVLDVQGGKALLMSRYALDCLPFHDEKNRCRVESKRAECVASGGFSCGVHGC